MNRSEIKQKAKASLSGKYGDVFSLIAISFGLSLGISIILGMLNLESDFSSFLSEICMIFLSGVLGFGTFSFFLKISRDEVVSYNELFSKTHMIWSYLGIGLLVGLLVLLWSFAFIFPGIIAALSYSMVFYIKLDNPDMKILDVLKKSKEMMSGHKWDFFVLGLSFIGWAILAIFTFGLLYFWLYPYMQVSFANFYNSIKDENKTTAL